MSDLTNLIPLYELPDHLPRAASGRKIHHSTVYRWLSRGVRGVRLQTVVIGGSRYVRPDDLQDFIERSTAAAEGRPHPRRRSRDLAIEAAERELDRAGI